MFVSFSSQLSLKKQNNKKRKQTKQNKKQLFINFCLIWQIAWMSPIFPTWIGWEAGWKESLGLLRSHSCKWKSMVVWVHNSVLFLNYMGTHIWVYKSFKSWIEYVYCILVNIKELGMSAVEPWMLQEKAFEK